MRDPKHPKQNERPKQPRRRAIVLSPGGGRRYPLGSMEAVFKADCDETSEAYSISEWWLEAQQGGPGAHVHDANDDVFYVLEGPIRFHLGEDQLDVEKGGFVLVPAGVMHDFENLSDHRVGMLNFYVPGGFEREMPGIVAWFRDHPND